MTINRNDLIELAHRELKAAEAALEEHGRYQPTSRGGISSHPAVSDYHNALCLLARLTRGEAGA